MIRTAKQMKDLIRNKSKKTGIPARSCTALECPSIFKNE